MADYNINIFLDDEKFKKIEGVELANQVKMIDGKKAIQVPFSDKEHKKLIKGFVIINFKMFYQSVNIVPNYNCPRFQVIN